MLHSRRTLAMTFACLLLAPMPHPASAEMTTIRFVPETEPTILDPVTSVAAVTQQHAYMIYDQLYGLDANGVPQPQMVESDTVDPSGRVHRLVLRAGLKFHDGTPVRAEDAMASIARWAQRDVVGTKLREMGLRMEILDERTFTIATNEPTPLVLAGLAKSASPALFVMRAEDAKAEPTRAVVTHIGSGPFRFVEAEYRAGDRLVYQRNADYLARPEPVSGYAGGKRVTVDRVEFRIIPDPATAAAALTTGEVDIYDAPPLDLVPSLRRQTSIQVRPLDRGGIMGVLRPNHLHPPFDDVRARQALLIATDQTEFMPAVGGDEPGGWRQCYSFLGCGTSNPAENGMESYRRPDMVKAKELLAASGYQNQPVLLLNPTDNLVIGPLTEIAAQRLRAAGFNMQVVSTDWATLLQRRAKMDTAAEGGWDLFLTWAYDFDIHSPATNFLLSGACKAAWFGWPCDPNMETLRNLWAGELEPARQRAIYEQIQAHAAETVPYVPLGEFLKQVAYRKTLTGLVDVPITVFWNVSKQ